jgi:hypothetical protein
LYGGRGRKHFHRLANQRFLELVKFHRNEYHESTSSKKSIALCILNEWKNQTPPGRFLQQDIKTEEWFEISTAKIQEKTCQGMLRIIAVSFLLWFAASILSLVCLCVVSASFDHLIHYHPFSFQP